MIKNLKLEFRWAIIFCLFTVFWFVTEKMLGLHDNQISKQLTFSYFFAIPASSIYFFALRNKKNEIFKGMMTWKQGMVSGIYMSFFIAIFSIIVNYVCFEFISPNYLSEMSKFAIASKAMNAATAAEFFNLKSYLLQGISSALSMGVVTSAIVAFFLQTKK